VKIYLWLLSEMGCSLQKIVLKVLRFCFCLQISANISTVIVAVSEMKLLIIFWLLVLLTWLWAGLHMVYQLLWLLVMFCIFNTSLVCITKNSACMFHWLFPSVLWHCWLGDGKGVWLIKNASQLLKVSDWGSFLMALQYIIGYSVP